MPLLNTEADLQSARQALMGNLARNCESRKSGSKNRQGEETTIFTRGDVCMELSSKGGLFVRPVNGDGRDYIGAGFGGLGQKRQKQRHWQMSQEQNDVYVLYHTTYAHHVSSGKLKEELHGRYPQEQFDNLNLFRICSTGDYDTVENIKDFALLCDEARQPEERVNPPPPAGDGCNPGPAGRGERSAATWSARHSPYVNKIVPALDELGWNQKVAGWPWQPDLLRASLNSDKRILIEVKPDCGKHNVITAIGQVICYSSGMKNVIKVIAVPGSNWLPPYITEVLKCYDIKILDLDRDDLLPLLKVIVE